MSYSLDDLRSDPNLIFKAANRQIPQVQPLDIPAQILPKGGFKCELGIGKVECQRVAEVRYILQIIAGPQRGLLDDIYICGPHHMVIKQNTAPNIARIKARKNWEIRNMKRKAEYLEKSEL
jgi:hypothetical protein